MRRTHVEADVELGARLDVLVEALLLAGLHPDPVVHGQAGSHDVELGVNRLRTCRQRAQLSRDSRGQSGSWPGSGPEQRSDRGRSPDAVVSPSLHALQDIQL